MTFTHLLGCAGGEVRVTRGITKKLAHCVSCGAEVMVPL